MSHTFLPRRATKRLSAVTLAVVLAATPLTTPVAVAAPVPTASTTTASTEIALMKTRWVERMIGSPDHYDTPEAKALVNRINNKGNALWETMIKSDVADREYLQPDPNGAWVRDPSGYFRDGFDSLRFITQAWATPGTDLYGREDVKKEIIAGLEHMIAKGYNGEQMFGNWWPWQIGGAQRFTDIVMLLDSKGALTQEQITRYANIISTYDPAPEKQLKRGPKDADGTEPSSPLVFSDEPSAGGNRLDIAVVVLGTGLLSNDPARVKSAITGIEPFMETTDGNGFRADGSYVDHGSFAYTGGYGEALIKALARILAVTADTSVAAGQTYTTAFGQSITHGVLPNIYRGVGVPSLKGRGLTRKVDSGPDSWCSDVVFHLVDLSASMPDNYKKNILAASKYWIDNNTECFNRKASSFADLNAINVAVTQGDTLTSRPDQGAYLYPEMDRFISRENDHVFNLGLYSDRISSYEVGAHENTKGWHYADGMTYLFNGDSTQFHGSYWPTVDPYRLPGTTVDTKALPDDDSSYRERPGKNMDATGGVATNTLSAIGQRIDKSDWVLNENTPNQASAGMDLKATKSWFVFNDRIIALGAGITGTTESNTDADGNPATITTVVDNRIIGDGLYTVTDGTGSALVANAHNLDTVIYKPTGTATPIAYRMLNGTKASYRSVDRTGTWNDINQREKITDPVSNTFGTLTIDHGAKATDATYAYSIEPGATSETLAKEKTAEPVTIVSNTSDVQSVETADGNQFAANVFAAHGAALPQGFAATTALSVVADMDKAAGTYTLTVSDPSQKRDSVSLTTPDTVLSATGDGVTFDPATHTLTVATAGKKGSPVTVTVTAKPVKDADQKTGSSDGKDASSDFKPAADTLSSNTIGGGILAVLGILAALFWALFGQLPGVAAKH